MGIIHVLDKSVSELIAAGEVVERPSSAIKELVENSIDAGATAITVEIQKGGMSFMRVTDNGAAFIQKMLKMLFCVMQPVKYKKQKIWMELLQWAFEARLWRPFRLYPG